ncbi:hypothetical protein VD0002_g8291 [Verticillium dahliae]|uniref:Uncharacterized protein n=1 Tax=Verticillium dahliae TaxID=27337 RepID=A0AA44WP45_VERDA|nr:hypothetical protein BJF96_g3629 [Verticillium dahliae]PNH46408.1 hypothetical protein VD0003_g9011 [Verticillium dahliae]PNH59247.1 hypothetical protein VD0002_g8291 [Verticillium dahliae]
MKKSATCYTVAGITFTSEVRTEETPTPCGSHASRKSEPVITLAPTLGCCGCTVPKTFRENWYAGEPGFPMTGDDRHTTGMPTFADQCAVDIISLSCIIGKSTVRQWVEEKNQKHRTWYWRQAVNVLSQQLSAPRHVCCCSQPENPDRLMIKCPAAGTGCGIWLHQACVAAFQTNVKPAQWGTPEEVADGGTNAGLSKRILCPACYAEI